MVMSGTQFWLEHRNQPTCYSNLFFEGVHCGAVSRPGRGYIGIFFKCEPYKDDK